jgi:O-antigen/teichoic acid export membrane protein
MRVAGYAAGMLLTLASAPLMIRHLGVDDYGRFATITALIAVVAGFTEAGLATIALREYAARSGRDRRVVMRDLIGIRLVLTIAGVLVGVAFTLVAGYDSVLVIGAAAAGFALVLQSLQLLLGVALQGELRFGWITVIDLLRQALIVAIIIALVVADAGLGPFFLAPIPAVALSLGLTAGLVRRLMPLLPAFHPQRWWPLLRITVAYAIAVALNAAYFRIAILALSLLASERETGYFATAYRVVEALIAVPALIIGAAFPILTRAARDDTDRLDHAASRLVEVALILGIWTTLGLVLAADPIIAVLAGDQSDPSVQLLRIQSFALMATFVIVAGGYVLLSLHRHRTLLLVNVAAVAASLVCTAVLVPTYEATGAAVVVLVAEVVLATATLAAVIRRRPAVAVAVRRAPAVIGAGLVAGLVGFAGLPDLVAAILALLLFPLLLLAVSRFPPEVRDALR